MQSAPSLVRVLGRTAQSVGAALDAFGLGLSPHAARDTLVPSTRVVPIAGRELRHGKSGYVASTASVVGDVHIGERSSVWYGAVVRGDKAPVRLGRNVAVLDNAMVSGGSSAGRGAELGNDVVIAPGAMVQSASIGDGAMVGMGASVLAGAQVGSDSFVDAGAVVAPGTVVPSGQLWTGSPARHLRALAPAEMAYLRSSALAYADLGAVHAAEGAKGVEAVEEEEELRWAKIEGGYAPNTPVSTEDVDVVEYYKLTQKHANPGLWREEEKDVAGELARREAEEIAADRAEEAYHNAVARNKRVAEALGALVGTRADRPEAREAVLAALSRRDAEGAGMLQALMHRAAAASAAGAAPLEQEEVLRAIRALTPAAPQELAPQALTALAAHGAAAAAGSR